MTADRYNSRIFFGWLGGFGHGVSLGGEGKHGGMGT